MVATGGVNVISRQGYVTRILAYVDTPFVKILTGIRRCGKSTIMKMLMQELRGRGIPENRIIHYAFDSLEYEGVTAKGLYTQLKSQLSAEETTYLFLDEIQEVPSWEKVVNSLMSDHNVDIYVTGSNSRMTSSEISTYLTTPANATPENRRIADIAPAPAEDHQFRCTPSGISDTPQKTRGKCGRKYTALRIL